MIEIVSSHLKSKGISISVGENFYNGLALNILKGNTSEVKNVVEKEIGTLSQYVPQLHFNKIDELEKILEHQPENYDAYYDLGKVHYEPGNYDLAIENFENILEYKEDNPYIYFSLAQAYEMNNEIDKAISNYLKTIAHDTGFRQAYKKVAILFLARGDYDDAIEYLEDYLEMELPDEEVKNVNELITRIKKKKNNG